MTRKTYVYDERLGKMVEGRSPPRGGYSPIVGDLPDFVSPIDGSVVNGRKGMREMFRRHGVTHSSDFTETWKKAEQERAKVYNGTNDKKARREAIAQALNKLGVR